jgi:orotate phosphoribosyltransferase
MSIQEPSNSNPPPSSEARLPGRLKERLFNLLGERSFRASETASFRLTSGQMSRFYIDCKTVSFDAEGAFLIGEILFDRIHALHPDGVGGMTLGADPIATAVSVISFIKNSPIPAFIVRKESKTHGSRQQVEAGFSLAGARVVVVEDVVTTGGSTLRTLEALRHVGCSILRVVALIDRQEGGAERIAAEAPFETIFTLDDFIRCLPESATSLPPSLN